MIRLVRALAPLRVLVLVALALPATAEDERVEVRVTASSGGEVYLDRGRLAGIEPDDRVVFAVAGHGEVEATVRAVSSNNARAVLPSGAPIVQVGSLGFVLVPAARLELGPSPPPTTGACTSAPEHPPWEHPPEEWSEDQPLLAPAFGLTDEERATTFHGRVFTQLEATSDRERDASTTLARGGVLLDVTNPLRRGGRFRFDGNVDYRAFDSDGTDDSDSALWLNRFSYEEGGTVDRPDRWEVGRFLQKEFPELQVLDGAEMTHVLPSGDRVGASLGAMPEPRPGLPSGDDLQAAVYWRGFWGEEQELAVGAALQGTWHEGESDRNLLLATVDWTPDERWWLRSTAWVDWYTASDDIKGQGAELTELQVQGGRRFGAEGGVSAFLSHRRWPELLRDEFARVDPEQIRSNRVDRIWLDGWKRMSETVRLRGRVGAWNDQDDSGGDAELGVVLQDLLWDRGQLDLALYGSGGSFSSIAPGFRATAARFFDRGSLALSYDFNSFEQEDFFGSQEELDQHALRAAWDWTFSDGWSVSVHADRRFGDEQDSYGTGFLIQRRF